MTKEQLGHFRTLLGKLAAHADRRLRGEVEAAQPTTETTGEPRSEIGDQSAQDATLSELADFAEPAGRSKPWEASSDEMSTDTALHLSQYNSDLRGEVDEALLRLDRGEYGTCEECGGEISVRRLEVLPIARTCAPCARLREERQGQRHHSTL